MPEGVVDDGQFVDSGHESSPSGRRPRQRPAGVPEAFVYDRKTGEWRMPRKPGPKADNPGPQSASESQAWRADRDPDPAHLAGDDNDDRGRDDGGRADPSAEDLENAAGLLALIALPIGAIAERRDPYCGGVFAHQLPQIVDAAVPIICRSERVMRWLSADTGGLMDWIGLATALAPVGRAFAEHHILKVVELVDEHQDQAAAAAA